MQIEGFNLVFGDSRHQFLADGKFSLENQKKAIVQLEEPLEVVLLPVGDVQMVLEVDTLKFVCSDMIIEPTKCKIILTVHSTAA